MFKIIFFSTVILNLSDFKTGDMICKYTNGETEIVQIKDKNNQCIEIVYDELKYKKILRYRTIDSCGFCGDYISLRGQDLRSAFEKHNNK